MCSAYGKKYIFSKTCAEILSCMFFVLHRICTSFADHKCSSLGQGCETHEILFKMHYTIIHLQSLLYLMPTGTGLNWLREF